MTVTHFMPEFVTFGHHSHNLWFFLWTETYRSHWLNNDCHSSQVPGSFAVLPRACAAKTWRNAGFGVSQKCWKKTQGDSSVMWLINDLNILKHLDILGYTWIYYDEHTISWYTWHRMNSWTWVEWTLMALMFVRTIMEKPQREDHFCPGSGHCP